MSLARQIVENSIREAVVDIDDELFLEIKRKADVMFTKIVGRPPTVNEYKVFFASVDHARATLTRAYGGGRVDLIAGGSDDARLKFERAVGRHEVSRRLGSSSRIGVTAGGARIFPTKDGISMAWPGSRAVYTYPAVFNPGSISHHIHRPKAKRKSYDDVLESAMSGEKLDVVFYTWANSERRQHLSGDQRFRTLLRRFRVPHKRKSIRLQRPDEGGHPVERAFSPWYETHVWVNCLPGDPSARQVKFDNRTSDEEVERWKTAADLTWRSARAVYDFPGPE